MALHDTLARWAVAFATIVLVAGGTATGLAQDPKGIALSEAVTVTAEVVAIDKADRIVTVVGPRGNVVDIVAGDEVRNFDQISVGDKVKATFFESVALYLGAPGSQPEVGAAEVVGRAAKGDMPAGIMLKAIDVSASVVAIDRGARELTLQLPNGHVVTNKVDPAVKAFDSLKIGDSIHARVTRALAIKVEPH